MDPVSSGKHAHRKNNVFIAELPCTTSSIMLSKQEVPMASCLQSLEPGNRAGNSGKSVHFLKQDWAMG